MFDDLKKEVAESVTVMGGAATLITGFRSRVAELEKTIADGGDIAGAVGTLASDLDGAQKGLEAAMAVNTPANPEVVADPAAAAAVADVVDASNPTNPDAPTS